MSTSFTIFFDGQFWIGVLERRDQDGLRAVKVTFGSEPSNAELYDWIRDNGNSLVERLASAWPVADTSIAERQIRNPKRRHREAARAAKQVQTSTAAQRAIKNDQQEQGRQSARTRRDQRRANAKQVRAQKRAQARAKHRGH